MSSRAMASQRNKRTSPYTNGQQTAAAPIPQKKMMSSSQRLSQLQGVPKQNGSVPKQNGSVTVNDVVSGRVNAGSRVVQNRREGELSIPEAFAMLNKKISILEEVLENKGFEFETHTSINKTEKIIELERKIDTIHGEINGEISKLSEEITKSSESPALFELRELKTVMEQKIGIIIEDLQEKNQQIELLETKNDELMKVIELLRNSSDNINTVDGVNGDTSTVSEWHGITDITIPSVDSKSEEGEEGEEEEEEGQEVQMEINDPEGEELNKEDEEDEAAFVAPSVAPFVAPSVAQSEPDKVIEEDQ